LEASLAVHNVETRTPPMNNLRFIDLFCGCGGFSLGMERAGLQCLAAVDFNPEAARIQSFPNWFEFPIARTHRFRVIGNAMPPLVSEAVGNPALD
jgi:site-specific DNA-cytosine methylase